MSQIAEIIEGHPVIHADSSERVRDVVRRMSKENVGAVPVLDSGRLVGVFSERDVMARVVAAGLDPDQTLVANVMTKEIVVADPGDTVDAALLKMHRVGCRHLPVVKGGNLVGMVSIRDLLEVDDEDQTERVRFLKELVTYSPDYES
ncbi:MAG TPA: CBS domain-containing protein [Thermoanaerobaculia bacterium]|jgi:CBS domain-containing protein|nr:CBS domain-containing protein [Thermoanaerobaculia bacterium]